LYADALDSNESKWKALRTVKVVVVHGFEVVTEIPFVDESTERELLSLLGDWYEPESIESLFSSSPSDAVFFSS